MYKAPPDPKQSGDVMDTPFGYLQDDYALALLTEAAFQTNHTSSTISSYERSTPSRTSITNHLDDVSRDQHQHRIATPLRTNTPGQFGDHTSFVPASRVMDTMSFNQSNSILTRQRPYMDANYRGIGTEISSNYASNLGILNAESYDDGSHAMSRRQMVDMHSRPQQQPGLPFGTDRPRILMDDERRTDSDEQERGTKKGKKHRLDDDALAEDEDDEARKKARGRPRVDTKDETPADVSFLHIYYHYLLRLYLIFKILDFYSRVERFGFSFHLIFVFVSSQSFNHVTVNDI